MDGSLARQPYLKTIIRYVSPDDQYDNFFPSGALRLSAGLHVLAILSGRDNKNDLSDHFRDWEGLYRHLPLKDFDEVMVGKKVQFWQDFMSHPDNSRRKLGDLDFGPEASIDFFLVELRWYDYWLKGIDNGILGEPPVSVFVMGDNRWREEHQWPLPRGPGAQTLFSQWRQGEDPFSRNTTEIQTPVAFSAADTELRKATQTIFHNARYPSHLVLPVVFRGQPAT